MAWKIDPSHSQVTFSVRHMMISNVRGRFESFDGTVDFNEEDPTKSSVNININAATINTRDPMRDNHLRSADFFDVEKYPTINFVSQKIEKVDDHHAKIHGILTIKEIGREVVLDTEYAGQSTMWGKTNAGFEATTKINRKDWELNWNKTLETGGWLVGDEIKIDIELELVKVLETVSATQSA
jgi:polyisoprenoid-binding protein YceI